MILLKVDERSLLPPGIHGPNIDGQQELHGQTQISAQCTELTCGIEIFLRQTESDEFSDR